jgi:hypothetical protein
MAWFQGQLDQTATNYINDERQSCYQCKICAELPNKKKNKGIIETGQSNNLRKHLMTADLQ